MAKCIWSVFLYTYLVKELQNKKFCQLICFTDSCLGKDVATRLGPKKHVTNQADIVLKV
jgi:hypothetical protein